MDLGMPIMDGFESCKKIKNQSKDQDFFNEPTTRQIPEPILQFDAEAESELAGFKNTPYIVSLSASEYDSKLLEKCKSAGFDDCFSVPLQICDMQEKIINKVLLQKALKPQGNICD